MHENLSKKFYNLILNEGDVLSECSGSSFNSFLVSSRRIGRLSLPIIQHPEQNNSWSWV